MGAKRDLVYVLHEAKVFIWQQPMLNLRGNRMSGHLMQWCVMMVRLGFVRVNGKMYMHRCRLMPV